MCREYNSDSESANGEKKDYINMDVGEQDGENVLQAIEFSPLSISFH